MHYDELPVGRVKSFSFCFFFFVHKEKEGPAARLPGLLIDVGPYVESGFPRLCDGYSIADAEKVFNSLTGFHRKISILRKEMRKKLDGLPY